MGYKEEIFERLEREGFTDVSQIVDWLAGDKPTVFNKKVKSSQKSRSRSSYTSFAQELAEPFELGNKIEQAETSEDLENIKRDIDSLSISTARRDLTSRYNSKLDTLKVDETEALKQEKEIIENEEKIEEVQQERESYSSEAEGLREQRFALEQEEGSEREVERLRDAEEQARDEAAERAKQYEKLRARIKELTKRRGR